MEQPNENRVITTEEWAQIRLNLFGEGTLLLCDLTLDCGLRYEEVTALRPVDVVDGDARDANHLWIRQAQRWISRLFRDSRLLSIGGGADEVMLQVLAKLDEFEP